MQMITPKFFHLKVLFVCLLSICWLSPAATAATVSLNGQNLTVSAENDPLESLLQMVTEKAGISIVYYGSLDQMMTIRITDQPLEQALRRLLRGCNFSFQYEKRILSGGQEDIVMTQAIVFAKSATAAATRFDPAPSLTAAAIEKPAAEIPAPQQNDPPSETPATAAPPAEATGQRVGNGVFVKTEKETIGRLSQADILSQLGGQTTTLRLGLAGGPDLRKEGSLLPAMEGVQVTGSIAGSIFEKIGLKTGDVIQDINGNRTTTPDQMADALLKSITESGGMVRIEVERGDLIEPIYVEIN